MPWNSSLIGSHTMGDDMGDVIAPKRRIRPGTRNEDMCVRFLYTQAPRSRCSRLGTYRYDWPAANISECMGPLSAQQVRRILRVRYIARKLARA